MYATRELNRLAVHKAALRRKVGLERVRCAVAATRVAQPLEWFDRALALWRQLSPLTQCVAVPLGLLFQRSTSPRLKALRAVVRWGPLALRAMRLASAYARSSAPARAGP